MEDFKASLDELAINVKSIGINLTFRFENNHDRFIVADNGCKITPGRGLDIFEKIEERFSVADIDQTKRKCKACEMTYLKIWFNNNPNNTNNKRLILSFDCSDNYFNSIFYCYVLISLTQQWILLEIWNRKNILKFHCFTMIFIA